MKSTIKSFLVIQFFLTSFLNSCSSNNNSGGSANTNSGVVSKDLGNFFTINFNNRTLTSYGAIVNSTNQKLPVCFLLPTTSNSSGIVKTGIYINCEGSVLNQQLYNVAPFYFNYHQPINAVTIESLSHTGTDVTGTYIGNGIFQSDYIEDLENGSRRYYIEQSSSYVFNITSAVNDIYEGNFTGFLLDGQNRIPMSGSFRAKHP